jgi:hypothetical protein
MVATLNELDNANTHRMWTASGDFVSLKPLHPTSHSSIIETFKVGGSKPGFAPFYYTFSYALFSHDEERRLIENDVIQDREVPGKSSKATKINIKDHKIMNVTPMRIILTDMTVYVPTQPVLALTLVINDEGQTQNKNQASNHRTRIPAVFDTQWSEVPYNRQLDMQLPPMSSLTIEYDLAKMEL